MQEVYHTTRLLLDPDNPSTDLTSAPVFQLVNGAFLNLRGKSVKHFAARAMPNTSGVLTVTLYNRRKVSYTAARLLVDAARGGVAFSSPLFESTVLVTLTMKSTLNGTWLFPSHVSVDMISEPWTLVTHLTKTAVVIVLHIGSIEDKRRDLYCNTQYCHNRCRS